MRAANATVHPCHFYRDDAALASTVARFLAPAFSEGQAMVIFSTPAHLAAIEKRLRAEALDVDGARSRGQYVAKDARVVMEALVEGDVPTAERFDAVVGSHIERASHEFGAVRAFGEIVSLMWRDGKRDAALRLEHLWNEAIGTHPLSLLCAYNVRSFTSAHDAAGVTRIISAHTGVLSKTA
jgi:hypothetical protein